MEISPKLYHLFVRPKWFSKIYIGNIISSNFNFNDKIVLDFGCGIGSSCFMFDSSSYLGIDCDSKRINYAKRLYPDYNFDVLQDNHIQVNDNSVDYILIVSVLHHISSKMLKDYTKEFYRVLKPNGMIIVIEPCLFEKSNFKNYFMTFFDKGKYIRNQKEYFNLFNNYFKVEVLKKYNQLLFYNKIFFVATSE